jgi:hypothetical protein
MWRQPGGGSPACTPFKQVLVPRPRVASPVDTRYARVRLTYARAIEDTLLRAFSQLSCEEQGQLLPWLKAAWDYVWGLPLDHCSWKKTKLIGQLKSRATGEPPLLPNEPGFLPAAMVQR